MIDIFFPIGLAAVKFFASAFVVERIQVRTEYVSVRRILRFLTEQIVKSLMNIALLLVSVYGSGWFLNRRMSVLLICSVYMASVIEGLVRLLRALPNIYSLLVVHHGNPRSYLHARIRREVYKRLRYDDARSSLLKRLFKRVMLRSDEEISSEVAHKVVSAVWSRVVGRFMATTTALAVYIVVFRFVVAPYLITTHTKLTVWQALLYPVAFASDYFFGTSLVKQVHTFRFRLFD
jgi:hypothetical protein